jgi:hypothetical protein
MEKDVMGPEDHWRPDELRTLAWTVEQNALMDKWEPDVPTFCMIPRGVTASVVAALYDAANELEQRPV